MEVFGTVEAGLLTRGELPLVLDALQRDCPGAFSFPHDIEISRRRHQADRVTSYASLQPRRYL